MISCLCYDLNGSVGIGIIGIHVYALCMNEYYQFMDPLHYLFKL